MKHSSERYKAEMKEPFKNKWLCKVTIGAINIDLQTHGYIESDEQLSVCSSSLDSILNSNNEISDIASFERNSTLADGTSLFCDDSLYKGLIFGKILQNDDTLSFTYHIDEAYLYRNVERLIFRFKNVYPRTISLTYDIADSPFYKTEMFSNNGYEFELDEQWENITYITVSMSNFSQTGRRLIIDKMLFGDIIEFNNEQLNDGNSIDYKQYKSFKSEELPSKMLTLNVLNTNQKYDIEDPQSDIRLLEKGQEVSIQFGYQYSDGTEEWIPSDKLILNDYDVNETLLNITCTDIVNNMSDYVEVDALSDGEGSIIESVNTTLSEGYENDIVFDSRVKDNSSPGDWIGYEGGRKEGLLMYANAYCMIMDIDSTNKLHMKLNDFVMESVSGDFAEISNIDSIKDYYTTDLMYFRDYATFEKDYTRADGKKIFPIESNDEFSGFIGKWLTDSDLYGFESPIELSITYTNSVPDGITLIFVKDRSVKNYKYQILDDDNVAKYESEEIEHDGSEILSFTIPEEYNSYRTIKFTFLSMYKAKNTVHIKAVKNMYTTDYVLDSSQYVDYYPSCENETLLKDLTLTGFGYVSETERRVIYQGYPSFSGDESIVLLSNPCYDIDKVGFNEEYSDSPTLQDKGVKIEVIEGKIKHLKLVKTDYNNELLSIYGSSSSQSEDTRWFGYNKTGEGVEISNQLMVPVDRNYNNVSDWYNKESSMSKIYKFNFLGDPTLENGDIIAIPRKQGDIIYIRIETIEHSFNGGGLRGYIEGRKI